VEKRGLSKEAAAYRKARIENNLIWDIAETLALRAGEYVNRPFMPEAERLLRLFKAQEGRYPADYEEVEARFPGCLDPGGGLRIVK
jgi:hypothetical protein